jgi:hypothetical protein
MRRLSKEEILDLIAERVGLGTPRSEQPESKVSSPSSNEITVSAPSGSAPLTSTKQEKSKIVWCRALDGLVGPARAVSHSYSRVRRSSESPNLHSARVKPAAGG